MTRKIFLSIMAAAGGVLLASMLIIMGCLYDYFEGVQEQELWEELAFAVTGVENAGKDYLMALEDDNNRLTWIDTDGSVLYDAKADEQTMENHAKREEVREAMNYGEGKSERYSDTLLKKTVYCAKRLSDGTILRISVSRVTLGVIVLGMLQQICAVIIVMMIVSFFLAKHIAERIVEPLDRIDLDHPLEHEAYSELMPMLERINQQRRQIERQMLALKQKQDEFEQIIISMNEGLVLLNDSGEIISINPAAKKIFQADQNDIGADFLTADHNKELKDAMIQARNEGHGESWLKQDGREYQIDVSRIQSEGTVMGVVLLAFDVTDKIKAERRRREFTANVSHELKTPLTTILGSAELMKAGMVQQEDIPRFAGHIYEEASRLLTLIEDIIRLSQLDEGVQIQSEQVDIGMIVAEAANQLKDTADKRDVSLNVNVQECQVCGVKRLFSEIAYNLIENAIKYNVINGKVDVTVKESKDSVQLIVSDTGIGIAPKHQDRVFERFYRVDKSHSKASGGTGLGLSIVKHAVLYLGATIDLQSELGKGTKITVVFPKASEQKKQVNDI